MTTAPVVRHARCAHRTYLTSCAEEDALLLQAAGRCQRCLALTDKLHHDHDHALGIWAVRGLICHPCNLRLGRVDAGHIRADHLDTAYLAAPWHLTHRSTPPPPRGGRPPMPVRPIRIGEGLWKRVQREADAEGISESEITRRALSFYIDRFGRGAPTQAGGSTDSS